MKQENVLRNIFISMMIGVIIAVGIFGALVFVSSNPVGATNGVQYTIMVSPVGEKSMTHLATSYKIIQNNWMEIKENDGRIFTVNVNNSHVIIEKK